MYGRLRYFLTGALLLFTAAPAPAGAQAGSAPAAGQPPATGSAAPGVAPRSAAAPAAGAPVPRTGSAAAQAPAPRSPRATRPVPGELPLTPLAPDGIALPLPELA